MLDAAFRVKQIPLRHSYLHYSPEIHAHMKAKTFAVHTLSTLGFKKTVDAEKAGYLQIRPTNTKAHLPAYWIAPEDKDAYCQCLLAIQEGREAKDIVASNKASAYEEELAHYQTTLSPTEYAMLLTSIKRHPKAKLATLHAKIEQHKALSSRFDAWCAAPSDWYLSISPELYVDDKYQQSRLHVDVLVSCPRPNGQPFNSKLTITLNIDNNIKEEDLKVLLVQAHIDHLAHVEALSLVGSLGQVWGQYGLSHTFDTLFIKVLNGATKPDDLKSGLLGSLLNDRAGRQALATHASDALAKLHPDISFYCSDEKQRTGLSMSLVLPGECRLRDIDLSATVVDTLLSLPTVHNMLDGAIEVIEQAALRKKAEFNETWQRYWAQLPVQELLDVLNLTAQKQRFFLQALPKDLSPKAFKMALDNALNQTNAHFEMLISMNSLLEKFGEDWVISRYMHARALNREIIIFAGPTNAGKTYQSFKEAYKGERITYLAPLRLLAMEGYDRFLNDERDAYLLTGEERIGNPLATCVASTIEMCDTSRIYDCAIIDEAQLITDPERGSAWTAALLGVAAKKVILTCPEESVDLLKSVFALTHEPVTVHTLERKSPLKLTPSSTTLERLQPGTALVAFSRRELLSYKAAVEEQGLRCALIYGALSPEVRRQQSALFHQGEADVLLATDAISMGLNLPISNMIITADTKYDGISEVPVLPALLRQIAGRAGRFGLTEGGQVSGLSPRVHQSIKRAFADQSTFKLNHFPLSLDNTMVQLIATMIQSSGLMAIQAHFQKIVNASHSAFKARITDEQQTLFQTMDTPDMVSSLSLQERFTLSCAPVNKSNERLWTNAVGAMQKRHTMPSPYAPEQVKSATQDDELKMLENAVSQLCLYRWLHYQFPDVFPDLDKATKAIENINALIMDALSKTINKHCLRCGCVISLSLPHKHCDACHQAMAPGHDVRHAFSG